METSEFLPESNKGTTLKWIKRNLLLILTLVGVAAGFGIGFGIRQANPSDGVLLWTGMPGELFMRMLKVSILPLLISCIIVGMSSLEPKSSGKLSMVSLGYILITNIAGSLLALVVAFSIKPGSGQDIYDDSQQPDTRNLLTEDIFADLIRNLIPDNMVAAAIQKSQTVYKGEQTILVDNTTEGLVNKTIENLKRTVGVSYGTNILGIIIICAVLGTAASQIGEDAKLFVEFFKALSSIIIKVLNWLIWATPLGVASLIAVSIASAERLEERFVSLGYFVLTVTIGLLVHMMAFIPLVYILVMRRNPLNFMTAAIRPMLTGFAPPSSAIAMPVVMRTCDEKLAVSKAVSGFVVPLATSINRDGSCLFITVAAVYTAQVTGVGLSTGTIIMMLVLSTVGSLAIPAIPSSSVVTLLIILSSLNIPPTNIGLIMSVEWILDRMRTANNILSSTLCAVVTNKICGFKTAVYNTDMEYRPQGKQNSEHETLNTTL